MISGTENRFQVDLPMRRPCSSSLGKHTCTHMPTPGSPMDMYYVLRGHMCIGHTYRAYHVLSGVRVYHKVAVFDFQQGDILLHQFLVVAMTKIKPNTPPKKYHWGKLSKMYRGIPSPFLKHRVNPRPPQLKLPSKHWAWEVHTPKSSTGEAEAAGPP